MKSRSECLQEYGSDYFIRQKISAGELFRIDKGKLYPVNRTVRVLKKSG